MRYQATWNGQIIAESSEIVILERRENQKKIMRNEASCKNRISKR